MLARLSELWKAEVEVEVVDEEEVGCWAVCG